MGASSKLAGNSTFSEVEDSMNPLHGAAVVASVETRAAKFCSRKSEASGHQRQTTFPSVSSAAVQLCFGI